jgi:hypothetical protein
MKNFFHETGISIIADYAYRCMDYLTSGLIKVIMGASACHNHGGFC